MPSRAGGRGGWGRPPRSPPAAAVSRCRWREELSAARGGVCPAVSARCAPPARPLRAARGSAPTRTVTPPPSPAEISPLPPRPRRGGRQPSRRDRGILRPPPAAASVAAGPGGGRGGGSGPAWGGGGGCGHGSGWARSRGKGRCQRAGRGSPGTAVPGALGVAGSRRRMLRARKPLAARSPALAKHPWTSEPGCSLRALQPPAQAARPLRRGARRCTPRAGRGAQVSCRFYRATGPGSGVEKGSIFPSTRSILDSPPPSPLSEPARRAPRPAAGAGTAARPLTQSPGRSRGRRRGRAGYGRRGGDEARIAGLRLKGP